MKIVGRRCQTPIGKRALMKAFHSPHGCEATAGFFNALRSAALFVFVLLFPVNISGAADIKIWEEFSGEKALAHVQTLVDFGPRPAGSDAIEKSRNYIEEQLRHAG